MAFIVAYCKAGNHVFAYDNSKPKPENCGKHKSDGKQDKVQPLKQKACQIR